MITEAYRRRLDDLAHCWSLFAQRPHCWELLRNCLPTHIVPVFGHRRVPCRYRKICPWCHARWVQEIWETFEGAMWPDDTREKSQCSLVWSAPVVNAVYSEQAIQTRLEIATSGFKTTNWPRVCGHVAWAQAVPWKSSPERYQVSWRWLGITEDHDPLTTKLCQPTRPVLARVLGRFFQYPVRMIQSEPWQVANVLDAQAGHRLFNRYGLLRASRGSQQELRCRCVIRRGIEERLYQFSRWLRGMTPEPGFTLNLMATDLVVL